MLLCLCRYHPADLDIKEILIVYNMNISINWGLLRGLEQSAEQYGLPTCSWARNLLLVKNVLRTVIEGKAHYTCLILAFSQAFFLIFLAFRTVFVVKK